MKFSWAKNESGDYEATVIKTNRGELSAWLYVQTINDTPSIGWIKSYVSEASINAGNMPPKESWKTTFSLTYDMGISGREARTVLVKKYCEFAGIPYSIDMEDDDFSAEGPVSNSLGGKGSLALAATGLNSNTSYPLDYLDDIRYRFVAIPSDYSFEVQLEPRENKYNSNRDEIVSIYYMSGIGTVKSLKYNTRQHARNVVFSSAACRDFFTKGASANIVLQYLLKTAVVSEEPASWPTLDTSKDYFIFSYSENTYEGKINAVSYSVPNEESFRSIVTSASLNITSSNLKNDLNQNIEGLGLMSSTAGYIQLTDKNGAPLGKAVLAANATEAPETTINSIFTEIFK